MDPENLKSQIGVNIALQRKRLGMTQLELAEKLNYSDKAVSKWERGESVPDVLTLVQLADLFEIQMIIGGLFRTGGYWGCGRWSCPQGRSHRPEAGNAWSG